MLKNIFRLCILSILATAVLVILTPILPVNNLLYPVRVDSAFVSQQQLLYEKKVQAGAIDSVINFLYDPSQLEIHYIDVTLTMRDSIRLKGWMSIDSTRMQSPLLLIIPDINEGCISYIPALKQFCDRGFNVCVMDMRGQGISGGEYYDPGMNAVNDVIYMVNEFRKMPFINQVALMGKGTGAGIVLKAVADSAVADVLVLENLPVGMKQYFRRKAMQQWGMNIQLIMPALIRSYERKTGINFDDFKFLEILKTTKIPQLFVVANFDTKKEIDESLKLYDASTYEKKKLYIDTNTFLKPKGLANNKTYYDKISSFINTSLPPKTKKTRFRKLAFQ